ncbi:MAG TPA: divergent polysaccharide deacetylase family protein [Candidatus Cybelea sp.]|nr:divergent polysaccharide deacetylase family protein [Candidatus Cybelea sp.]
MRARPRHSSSGGAFLWLLIGVVAAVLGGGGLFLVLYPAPGWAPGWVKALHGNLAESGTAQGEVATSPTPHATAQPAATNSPAPSDGKLNEMPAMAETSPVAESPDHWPALAPSALLNQAHAAPDRALAEGAADLPGWKRYARPFTPAGKPALAILVTGLGTDRAVTAAAITGLPMEVTLSFDAYAPELGQWIAAARAFGHEAMVDLPMQSKDYPIRDPGSLGLLAALSESDIDHRIDALSDAGDHAFGFASADGDAFLSDEQATGAALRELAKLELAFIDTSGSATSQSEAGARAAGVPYARTAVTLDDKDARDAIAERLAVASDLASKQNGAIAVTHGSAEAVVAVAAFARGLGDQGPVLAPASALLVLKK